MGLLTTMYQKFYAALQSMRRLQTEKDLFLNISCLDNFFSEMRSTTLVLQKSLAHTDFFDLYKQLCQKWLSGSDCKWLADTRNDTIHESSFKLEKKLVLIRYISSGVVEKKEHSFNIEEYANEAKLEEDFKRYISTLPDEEIFFTIQYEYCEQGKSLNILTRMSDCIRKMHAFIIEISNAVKDESVETIALQQRVEKLVPEVVGGNSLFMRDYSYSKKQNSFRQAEVFEPLKTIPHIIKEEAYISDMFPAASLKVKYLKSFLCFTLHHALAYVMQQYYLMPTIAIVKEDGTMEFDMFVATEKTMIYRKIDETARRVKEENIVAVYVVYEVYTYQKNKDIFKLSQEERLATCSPITNFAFSYVIVGGQNRTFLCPQEKLILANNQYVKEILETYASQKGECIMNSLMPIIEAFKSKYTSETQ